MQKGLKTSNNTGGAGKTNTRNTNAGGHGAKDGSDPFRHSFKRSFNMTNR
jgi:hypothetical protein